MQVPVILVVPGPSTEEAILVAVPKAVREEHRHHLGFVAIREVEFHPGHYGVVYLAKEQGIDVGSDKYAVVCECHGTICGASNLRDAVWMAAHVDFCEECQLNTGLSPADLLELEATR